MSNKERDQYTLSDKERLQRIVDRDEIEQIIARRVFYQANEEREREIRELWVKLPENKETASFGMTWGFYKGIDSIKNSYVKEHEKRLFESLQEYYQADMNICNSKDNLGYGSYRVSPLIAPAIQVAGDGKTAKGLWYSIGVVIQGHPDQTADTNWLSTKIAVDFIHEPEGWKIWHAVEVHDSYFPAGTSYFDTPDIFVPNTEPFEKEFARPDIEVLTHDKSLCWADDYPWMPEPYETLTDALSYGPEGWPHINLEVFPQ